MIFKTFSIINRITCLREFFSSPWRFNARNLFLMTKKQMIERKKIRSSKTSINVPQFASVSSISCCSFENLSERRKSGEKKVQANVLRLRLYKCLPYTCCVTSAGQGLGSHMRLCWMNISCDYRLYATFFWGLISSICVCRELDNVEAFQFGTLSVNS